MKRWILVTVLMAGVATLAGVLRELPTAANEVPSEPGPAPDFQLKLGESVFWPGEYIEREFVPTFLIDVDPATIGAAHWDYQLEVLDAGAPRLRVSLDMILCGFRGSPDVPGGPDLGGTFRLQVLRDGDGDGELEQVGADADTFGAYTCEVFVAAPEPGLYTVRVTPWDVVDRAFRMRALLERPPTGSDKPRVVLPNLRIVPPYEPTFITGTVGFGPGLHVPGAPVFSCMADEMIAPDGGEPPRTGVCLHFSAGLENAGVGPLWIDTPDDQVERQLNQLSLPAHQVLFDSTGQPAFAFAEGSAGRFEFHAAHAHYHYEDIYTYELWRVANPDAEIRADAGLHQSGDGHKLGFLPIDELMTDWRRFYQEPQYLYQTQDGLLGRGGVALTPGWADIYEWNRSGQYVDFPVNEDGSLAAGHYVIRGTADAADLLVESNEADNVSYALIRVESDGSIDLLERGYGTDPWDPEGKPLGPYGSPWNPDAVIVGPLSLDE